MIFPNIDIKSIIFKALFSYPLEITKLFLMHTYIPNW